MLPILCAARRAASALLASALLFTAPAPAGALRPADEAADIVAQLKSMRDTADPQLIARLAEIGTREAMQGLVEAYGSMSSIFMRREVVRALARFDGVPTAEEPALEKIASVATESREEELRDAAIAALARSPSLGKHFLRRIVESPAEDSIREAAMVAHVGLASAEDRPWYRTVYKPPQATEEELRERKKDAKRKKIAEKRGEEVEQEVRVPVLGELRKLAFDQIAGELEAGELVAALSDGYPQIRGAALLELERRSDEKLLELATRMYEGLDQAPETRSIAAGVVARARGTDVADDFIDTGLKVITPHALRNELADLLRAMNDREVDKKLLRQLGKGKRHEKLFVLRAVYDFGSESCQDKLIKLAQDKDPEVAAAACHALGRRGDASAVPELRKLVEDAEDLFVRSAAIEALAALRAKSPEWEGELRALAAHEDIVVRNLALRQLGRTGKQEYVALLERQLASPDWSTRLAALEGLESYRSAQVVPAIVAQMEHESGRMVKLFADALWRLTGQPFETNVARWKAWWQQEGASFEVVSEARLAELVAEREQRRLKEVSQVKSEFFGIQIESQRVIFILDISGSMAEGMRPAELGGSGRTRIEVAREELKKAVNSLGEDVLFNIIVFSGDFVTWLDAVVPANAENKEKAAQFVDRLGVGGATNIYGALQRAFEDPDVDTLFVVSDGEPAGGTNDDPDSIREEVASWNAQRKIEINTITVGGRLQILRWLAEDSGGSHVQLQ